MAVTSDLVRLTLRYTLLGQRCQTARDFSVAGAGLATTSVVDIATAWWNDVKEVWRNVVLAGTAFNFDSILAEERGGLQGFGEFTIPVGEQLGTRGAAGAGDFMPPNVNCGVRLSVSTRLTRPGQMRLPALLENDNVGGILQPVYRGIAEAIAAKYATDLALGAPALSVAARAVVVKEGPDFHSPLGYQFITGFKVADVITTQNSRKIGRGQ